MKDPAKPILERVYFQEAYGLREGDSVSVLGVRIGRVKQLEIDFEAQPDQRIRAVLVEQRRFIIVVIALEYAAARQEKRR